MTTICHQFPLRPEYLAQVVVPSDLTREEAERLCAFLQSLAMPKEPRMAPQEKRHD